MLLIGSLGTCLSCLGFGFSRSFVAAAVFRTLGGVLNSNVGVMRTMIAEIIEEKKYAYPLYPFVKRGCVLLITETLQISISSVPFAAHVL